MLKFRCELRSITYEKSNENSQYFRSAGIRECLFLPNEELELSTQKVMLPFLPQLQDVPLRASANS